MEHSITTRGAIVAVLMVMLWSAVLAKPPGRMVDIGDRKLHVVETAGEGPVVVLEAGGGTFSSHWHKIQGNIRDELDLRVISYDRAGLGWSDPGALPYRIQDKADDLDALLTALDVDTPVILVATSFGAWVAQSFSSRYPERVAALVLVEPNTSYFFAQYPNRVRKIEASGRKRPVRGLKRVGLKLQRNWFAKQVGVSRSYFEPILYEQHQIALGHMLAAFGSISNALAEVRFPNVPTIMISRGLAQKGLPWGDDRSEVAWRDGHKDMIKHISKAQHWIATDAAHGVVFARPDMIRKAVALLIGGEF